MLFITIEKYETKRKSPYMSNLRALRKSSLFVSLNQCIHNTKRHFGIHPILANRIVLCGHLHILHVY